ncbi:hypothetical protein HRU87_07035 [Aquiluna borgnonia]|uniref:Uncharacterized protein n=1 Tax=Aquiluna borgnonia TaxID=2499157 RepID=A0A7D4TJR2_9MICO|nr:DUF6049 family protein [Aquiluna borgnonia]QKJ25891.1 hypothetical protein HRU87_07035 [Aquiluna borgnonia]
MKRLLALVLTMLALVSPAQAETSELYIVPGSEINLVARDGRIPVTIKNDSLETQTVTLNGASTTFRLEILSTTEVTIPAGSSQLAEIPVRALANGPVELKVWLEQDGREIGESELLQVNVNYDVELFLLVSFGFLMFALIVVGIFRTVLKFRRRASD